MDPEHYSEDSSEYLLVFRRLLHYGLVPVLVLLLVVLYLEFFAHLGHGLHQKLTLAENVILLYFVLEVMTDFILFEDTREFFSKKWFDILLVIPFLQTFRAMGRAGKALRGIRLFRSLQVAQMSNVGRTLKTLRLGKSAQKVLKTVPKVQKFLHLVRKLPYIIRTLPRVQSAIHLLSRAKQVGTRVLQSALRFR